MDFEITVRALLTLSVQAKADCFYYNNYYCLYYRYSCFYYYGYFYYCCFYYNNYYSF